MEIDGQDLAHAWQDFYASEPHRVANFGMAAFTLSLRDPAARQRVAVEA